MYVLLLTYTAAPDRIAEVRPAHRDYLDRFLASGNLLVSGPQVPPTGGVILAHFPSRSAVDAFTANDPFTTQSIATYTTLEFTPVKQSEEVKAFLARHPTP